MTPESLEALLTPIAPDAPGGADPLMVPECDEIRKRRKGDDQSLSQGEWVHELRHPQWPKVVDLCEEVLATRSKDLQVACWYLEARTYTDGFRGLAFGLALLRGLLERFWDSCYPQIAPGDQEERAAKLEWLNSQLPLVIKNIPVTSTSHGGFSSLQWEESRYVENLGLRDPRARDQAIAEGKLAGEVLDKAVEATGQAFYLDLAAGIRQAQTGFRELERTLEARFDPDVPGLGDLGETIQSSLDLATSFLHRFGVSVEPAPASVPAAAAAEPAPERPVAAVATGPVASRADAVQRLREVASYFKSHEPHSPVGPLVERAARWCEMDLGDWLARVVKDDNTLRQLRELLDLNPNA
jgi:type VI secretion system protein ImpA